MANRPGREQSNSRVAAGGDEPGTRPASQPNARSIAIAGPNDPLRSAGRTRLLRLASTQALGY